MSYIVADRVRDTSTTTGTGTLTVSGTPPQTYRTFSAVCVVNDIIPTFVQHQSADEWEAAIYTYSALNQLARTTILASSNAGAAVNFSAGTKDVVHAHSAEKTVYADDGDYVTLPVRTNRRSDGWGFPARFTTHVTGDWVGTFARWEASANAPDFTFAKSRGASVGTHAIVQNADILGSLWFAGDDGAAFQPAAAIRSYVDGVPGLGDMPGVLTFETTPDGSSATAERVRIDSFGNVVIGAAQAGALVLGAFFSGSVAGGGGGSSNQIQNWGSSANTGSATFGMFNATAGTGPHLDFYRSKNATVGQATVVASGDTLGEIYFAGAQQTGTFSNSNVAAKIGSYVDGTVTSGAGADMPGRLVFFTTPDGSGTPAERLRIDAGGTSTFTPGAPDPSNGIDTFGVVTTGSFGGGIGMIDGTGNIGFWSTNTGAQLNIGFATSLGSMPVAWSLDNAGVFNSIGTPLILKNNTVELARFDSSSRFILGGTATLSVGGNADQFQNWGTTLATGGTALGMFSATAANGAHLDFYRSKNATIGSATVVATDDVLGEIYFYGAQQTGTFATQNPAAKIQAAIDAAVTSGAGADMPGRLVFFTTPDASGTLTEALRINKDQQISTRGALRTVAGTSSYLQVNASGGGIHSETLLLWEVSASGPSLSFGKSRNNTVGSHTIVQNGEGLGNINFLGSNGTDFDYGAQIQAFVDGTPGASNDMPTRLGFYTSADASATPTERVRISSAGAVYFPSVGTTAGGGSGARLDNATTPANSLLRDTSSLRYKINLTDVPEARLFAALDDHRMRVIEFNSKSEHDDQSTRFVGLGAEYVADVDPALVAWRRDYEGGPLLPDGVQYDRVNLLRTEALKLRCVALEAKIARLEQKLSMES